MRANATSIDITPPLGVPLGGNPRPINAAVGVHDPLAANILCLDDGSRQAILIGLDLLGVEQDVCDKIRCGITARTGIPRDCIMISSTHTHSGPNTPRLYYTAYEDPTVMEQETTLVETYLKELTVKVIDGATAALSNLEECILRFGQASDGRFSHNRRIRMKDGSICMIFEPYNMEDILGLSAPISADTVSVLSLERHSGEIMGLYVHYATHPAIACGLDFLISRDFPGYMTDNLQRWYGADTVVLYANGAEGNMAVPSPEEGFVNSFEECARVGIGLAKTVKTILDTAAVLEAPVIHTAETQVEFPYRSFSREQVQEARAVLSAPSREEQMHGAPPKLSAMAVLKYDALQGKTDTAPVQGIAIGPLLLMGVTTETFRELAIHMEAAWDGPALLVGMANGYNGYIPTQKAFSEGGYEVLPNEDSRYAENADQHLLAAMEAVQNRIKEIRAE